MTSSFEKCPLRYPVDILGGHQFAQSVRKLSPFGVLTTTHLAYLQCGGRHAFVSQDSALHFMYALILRWVLRDYVPNARLEYFVNDMFLFLLTRHKHHDGDVEKKSTAIISPLFTEEARSALLRPDRHSLKCLALAVSDVYTDMWASWTVDPPKGTAKNTIGVYQKAINFCDKLCDAPPELRAWASKLYWNSSGQHICTLYEDPSMNYFSELLMEDMHASNKTEDGAFDISSNTITKDQIREAGGNEETSEDTDDYLHHMLGLPHHKAPTADHENAHLSTPRRDAPFLDETHTQTTTTSLPSTVSTPTKFKIEKTQSSTVWDIWARGAQFTPPKPQMRRSTLQSLHNRKIPGTTLAVSADSKNISGIDGAIQVTAPNGTLLRGSVGVPHYLADTSGVNERDG